MIAEQPIAPRGCMLVVDADEGARRTIAEAFRRRGWNVITAADVREAMELAVGHHPIVIVSELVLPDARGYHFARTLRGAVEHDIRLVAVTRLSPATFDEARAAGFDHVFAKPLDVEAVERALAI